MRIYVYAICKNESQFVDRFMESCREADGVYVLDTGSTDDTVEKLKAAGANVRCATISPWRFDSARNLSLQYVPDDADICVCLDLDEVLCPGWRDALEQAWREGTTQARYKYVWNVNEDGSDGVAFLSEKAHARRGYMWKHPVHEALMRTDGNHGVVVIANGMTIKHYPDHAKPRSQYLPLLEQAVAESPDDDRMAHYLGREYMFYGRWLDAIETLERHLDLPTALWREERAASMRFIAKCWEQLGAHDTAELWHFRAIYESPDTREPLYDAAEFYERARNWKGLAYVTERALSIPEKTLSYITNPDAWGERMGELNARAWLWRKEEEMARLNAQHNSAKNMC